MKFLEVKQIEAKARQDYYNTLTVQQKIDALDRKFGKGLGAASQRKKLSLVSDVAEISKAVVSMAKKGKK